MHCFKKIPNVEEQEAWLKKKVFEKEKWLWERNEKIKTGLQEVFAVASLKISFDSFWWFDMQLILLKNGPFT